MKAKTVHGAGSNNCLLFFIYEDYSGDRTFRNYNEAKEVLGNEVFITGMIYNTYYNCTERAHSVILHKRPTVSKVKQFIRETKKILGWL